jgi:hypothetical protein
MGKMKYPCCPIDDSPTHSVEGIQAGRNDAIQKKLADEHIHENDPAEFSFYGRNVSPILHS